MAPTGLPGSPNFTLVRRFVLAPHKTLVVCRGDLTQFRGDAIVNAGRSASTGEMAKMEGEVWISPVRDLSSGAARGISHHSAIFWCLGSLSGRLGVCCCLAPRSLLVRTFRPRSPFSFFFFVHPALAAANQGMLGGGGVDGAIHNAAGPRLLADCRRVAEVAPGLRCPTGQARLTPGGDLCAKYVIHTVGPVYPTMDPEAADSLLRSSYLSSLAVANGAEYPPPRGSHPPPSPPAFSVPGPLDSIAFPAISCGVFGFPVARASEVAVEACRDGVGNLQQIWFVLFNDTCWNEWVRAAGKILTPEP